MLEIHLPKGKKTVKCRCGLDVLSRGILYVIIVKPAHAMGCSEGKNDNECIGLNAASPSTPEKRTQIETMSS